MRTMVRPRVAALLMAATYAQAAFTDPVDLFVAGSPPEVNNYRIPALVRTRKGTLVAIAEARTSPADCCYKWLSFVRSTDNGTSWSQPAELWGRTNLPAGWGAGNPAVVYDNITDTIILHGSVNTLTACSPTLYTFQLTSTDEGVTWGSYLNLTSFLGQYDGATPGPGTGTQLGPNSPAPGRLIVPAHYGVYQDDVSWYSDDHGQTWTLSQPPLPHLDEVVTAALPSGKVMLNARTAHYNSSCACRAVTTSSDGGKTWDTPVQWDATLIEPVCQGNLITMGPLADINGGTALFFSNPASKSDRANMTIRRSDDEGHSWRAGTWLVSPGEQWGAYSCMTNGAPMTRADGVAGQEYGGIVWEQSRPGGPPGTPEAGTDVYVIRFALFPVNPPPQPRTFIPASHPSITWQGRTAVRPDGSVSFDFPAVTASLTVQGATYFEAQFFSTCSGGPRLEASIDGSAFDTTSPDSFWLYGGFSMPHTVPLAKGLDPTKTHSLGLRLATEARWGNCTGVSGVTLAGVWTDGTPLPAPAPLPRALEWVGDSITAGFGTAPKGGANPCPDSLSTQDASRAAPVKVCAALNASCTVVAISGDYVLTPTGGAPADKPPLATVYPRALTYVPYTTTGWNFNSAAAPQAIILNLGTNDQAEPNFNTSYVPALVDFLIQLSSPAGWYATAGLPVPTVLMYCGPMKYNYCEGMGQAASLAGAVGAKAVFMGSVNATLDGCAGHPGPQGQAQMATQLQQMIVKAMGW